MPARRRKDNTLQASGMSTSQRIGSNIRAAWGKNFKPIKPGQVRTAGSRKR